MFAFAKIMKFCFILFAFFLLSACGGGSGEESESEGEEESPRSEYQNAVPVAVIQQIETVIVSSRVMLDGSGSYDEDGDNLTYLWQLLSCPEGSGAELTDADSSHAYLMPDVQGEYAITLVVSDGHVDSQVVQIVVQAIEEDIQIPDQNTPPVAIIKSTSTVSVSSVVTLDGSESYDAEGNALSYLWRLVSYPAGSGVSLLYADSVQAGFVPDVPGEYRISLTVNDGVAESTLTQIVIKATEEAVITVNSGNNQRVMLGSNVKLNGDASNGNAIGQLFYKWTQISGPTVNQIEDSKPVLNFTAPLYPAKLEFVLSVSDGARTVESEPVEVLVSSDYYRNPSLVSIADNRSCVIAEDGAHCWGSNSDLSGYISTVPEKVKNPTFMATSKLISCIANKTQVDCWGDFGQYVEVMPESFENVTAIAVTNQDSCAIDSGSVICWSDGVVVKSEYFEELGIIDAKLLASNREYFCVTSFNGLGCWNGRAGGFRWLPIEDVDSITSVSMAENRICVVNDGNLRCWDNYLSYGSPLVPVAITGNVVGAELLSMSEEYTCVSQALGVKCWNNKNGQPVMVPERVANAHASSLDLSNYHACIVTEYGVDCWSLSENWGRWLGLSIVPGNLVQPTSISGGEGHVCVTDASGLSCWGGFRLDPTDVGASAQLGNGNSHACALAGGSLSCWGGPIIQRIYREYDEYGLATENSRPWGPTIVPQSVRYPYYVAAAEAVTCVLDHVEGARCWGARSRSIYPFEGVEIVDYVLPAFLGASSLSTDGRYHVCGLREGKIICARIHSQIRFSTSSPTVQVDDPTQLIVDTKLGCVLNRLGVECWGDSPEWSMLSRPAANVNKISMQLYFEREPLICALGNGEVRCWDVNGNTDIPVELHNPFDIAATGSGYTCALQSNTVRCWGKVLR